MAHDKFKTCAGCPDRVADPRCHDSCKGYKARQDKQAKINAERKKDIIFNDVKIGVTYQTKKRLKNGTLKSFMKGGSK